MRTHRRILLALGMVGVLALGGCRGTGTINVRSDDQIDVHIEAWADDPEDPRYLQIDSCEWIPTPGSGLTSTPVEQGETVGCIVQGTTGLHGVVALIPFVTQHVGDRYLFGAGGPAFEGLVTDPGGNTATVTMTFPGPVVASSSGTINGNSVTFTDMNTLALQGIAVSAMDHEGLTSEQSWMLAAAGAGAVLGSGATGLVLVLRRRGSDGADAPEEVGLDKGVASAGPLPVSKEKQPVTPDEDWAPE